MVWLHQFVTHGNYVYHCSFFCCVVTRIAVEINPDHDAWDHPRENEGYAHAQVAELGAVGGKVSVLLKCK